MRPPVAEQVGLDTSICRSRDQLCTRVVAKQREARGDGCRSRESSSRERLDSRRRALQAFTKLIVGRGTERECGIANRSVPRTAAQVSGECHRVAWAFPIRAIVFCKQTDDETWRAVAALRAAPRCHRGLCFAQNSIGRK